MLKNSLLNFFLNLQFQYENQLTKPEIQQKLKD